MGEEEWEHIQNQWDIRTGLLLHFNPNTCKTKGMYKELVRFGDIDEERHKGNKI